MTTAAPLEALPPWLKEPWAALQSARHADRFPHALLLTGTAGVGKRRLLEALAHSLLCPTTRAGGWACGQCPDCRLLAAGTHPDLARVGPDEEGKSGEIKVDAIRALASAEGLTAHRGGWKLILIDPAHRMNASAANALLKTLEEPPGEALFVLCARRADALAPTIRSRCRLVRLPKPDRTFARAWLAETAGVDERDAALMLAVSGGAPLRALRLAEPAEAAAHRATLEVLHGLPETDVASAADRLMRLEPTRWMPVLQAWIGDLARVCAGGRPSWLPEQARRLAELSARTRLADVLDAQSRLQTQAGVIDHPLNPRLYCEGALLSYCSLYSRSGRRT